MSTIKWTCPTCNAPNEVHRCVGVLVLECKGGPVPHGRQSGCGVSWVVRLSERVISRVEVLEIGQIVSQEDRTL